MKKLLRITLLSITVLAVAGFIIFRIWFYNPYPDILRVDPKSVFSNEATTEPLLIRNATLIDVEAGKAVENTHLVIQGDTISKVYVGEIPELSGSYREYNARNRYLMPGLFDMHVHLAMHIHRLSGDEGPRDSLASKTALEQFVRYGVTTVFAHGGGGSNDEQAVELKQLERNNAIVSPWLFATGDVITAPGSHPITTIMRLPAETGPERLHQAGVTVVADGDDPAHIVTKKKELGLDGVKIIIESGPPPWYPNPRMSVETAERIVNRAKEADMPVYAHAHVYNEFSEAVRLSVRGLMHGVMDTLIHDSRLIDRMKKEEIWYIPTLSVLYGFQFFEEPERLEDDFLRRGVSKRTIRGLEHPLFRFGFKRSLSGFDLSKWLDTSMRNLALMHREGVNVALGTDASTPFNFPGYNAHVEMELMALAGLSNADILRIATVNGARFLKIEDKVGTISPGKIANLIILNENPLTDIRLTRTIEKIILKGRFIDEDDQVAVSSDYQGL